MTNESPNIGSHVLRLKGKEGIRGNIFYSHLDINMKGHYIMCNGRLHESNRLPGEAGAERFKAYYKEGSDYEVVPLWVARHDWNKVSLVQKIKSWFY